MNMKSFELTFRWRERDGRLFVVNSKSRMLSSPQRRANFLEDKSGVFLLKEGWMRPPPGGILFAIKLFAILWACPHSPPK